MIALRVYIVVALNDTAKFFRLHNKKHTLDAMALYAAGKVILISFSRMKHDGLRLSYHSNTESSHTTPTLDTNNASDYS